jgi:hypothetical protein
MNSVLDRARILSATAEIEQVETSIKHFDRNLDLHLQPRFPLFNLPLELRELIYESALYDPKGVQIPEFYVQKYRTLDLCLEVDHSRPPLDPDDVKPQKFYPALLYTNHQIRVEALPLLFQVNKVCLVSDWERNHYIDMTKNMTAILDKAEAWERVQSLQYVFTRMDRTFEAVESILHSLLNLREVTIIFGHQDFAGGEESCMEEDWVYFKSLTELPKLQRLVLHQVFLVPGYVLDAESSLRRVKQFVEGNSDGRVRVKISVDKDDKEGD